MPQRLVLLEYLLAVTLILSLSVALLLAHIKAPCLLKAVEDVPGPRLLRAASLPLPAASHANIEGFFWSTQKAFPFYRKPFPISNSGFHGLLMKASRRFDLARSSLRMGGGIYVCAAS